VKEIKPDCSEDGRAHWVTVAEPGGQQACGRRCLGRAAGNRVRRREVGRRFPEARDGLRMSRSWSWGGFFQPVHASRVPVGAAVPHRCRRERPGAG